MSRDTETSDALEELDELRLRQAVEQVRARPVPEDAMTRAVQRAQELTTAAVTVRRQPAIARRPRRWIWKAIVGTAMCLFFGAIIWFQLSLNEREGAEFFATSAAPDTDGIPMTISEDGNLEQITGGKNFGIPVSRYRAAATQIDYSPVFGFDGKDVREGKYKDGMSNTIRVGETPNPLGWPNNRLFAVWFNQLEGKEERGEPVDPKRIIYTAEVALVVEDVTATETQLNELVQRLKGYVVTSQIEEPQGQQRTGKWVIRVPVDQFDGAMTSVAELGNPENRSSNAHDVTEAYADLEVRIAGKKKLEQRILGLLDDHTGDIKDVIVVEEQLVRVREEIERMAARLKNMQTLTAMSTITVTAREQRDYVPPQAPTFSTQISQYWGDSLAVLQNFGKSLVLVTVAVAPWLPVLAVTGLLAVILLKRWRGKRTDVQAG